MEADMSEHTHTHEKQDVQVSVQDIIDRFGREIGGLRAQMLMDQVARETESAAWAEERHQLVEEKAHLMASLDALTTRLAALEGAAPGDAQPDEGDPSKTPRKRTQRAIGDSGEKTPEPGE